ncbi:hypothetical protein E0H26_06505 [Micromonospora zingiberis]|uniref:Glycerophosphoryl diester phosphodiesterase membrane domain-containing protein n=1 Tax=Micromonospora zingiberis TaxID=2053011 RepID=A0A4R0GQJ3_9ACTN|nr:hypothetical protein [Micromonospora zingiberis]TCB99052.1 hypothetical protein E0H26_06505 [Micromonospora zingiberis]
MAYPGQPYPGQPYPGQPYPGQPYPGQPYPGQPYPGQPYPGQPYPGQPGPAAGYPGQPGFPTAHPGQPGPAATYPGQAYSGWHDPAYGLDPADALVTPPGAGLGGWFTRCLGAVRRGWHLLLPILVLTQVLPAVVLSVLGLFFDPSARWEADIASDSAALPANFWVDSALWIGPLVAGSLLFGLVQCLGWAAGTWVIARQAAGEPVGLGAAFQYGLRRALGLWGWLLIFTVILTVGFCLCFLPGIYAAFALAMAGPVYLFERRDPIGRSHRMLRDRLGLLLGRVALMIGVVIGIAFAVSVVESVARLPFGVTPMDSVGTAVGVVLVTTVAAVLALPAHLAQLVGLVVTYAEQRAHEGPVNSGQLAAELG